MANDSNGAWGVLGELLKALVGLAIPVFGYLGIRWQYRERKKSKNEGEKSSDNENIPAGERLLHSQITKGLQNTTSRIRTFNGLNNAVRELFRETRADRFLILIAINGTVHYKTVSVIYQKHENDGDDHDAVKRYGNIVIDDAYRKMLKDAEYKGCVNVLTAQIKDTLLGNIYRIEKIIQSRVYFVKRIMLEEKGKDVMVYVSIATHDKKGFTIEGVTLMNMIVDSRIKNYVADIIKPEFVNQ